MRDFSVRLIVEASFLELFVSKVFVICKLYEHFERKKNWHGYEVSHSKKIQGSLNNNYTQL